MSALNEVNVTDIKSAVGHAFPSRNELLCFKCDLAIAPLETIYGVRVATRWHFNGGGCWVVTCASCAATLSAVFFQPQHCEHCKRLVRKQVTGLRTVYVLCSDPCRDEFYRKLAAERRKAARANRETLNCETCNRPFEPRRTDAKHCSPACKQKAYRQRQKATAV